MSEYEWNEQHLKYAKTDWINKPSLFSQQVVKFFPKTGKVLDMGCGQGQDSRFFSEHGYGVVGIDFSNDGIRFAKTKSGNYKNLDFKVGDISEKLPFEDSSFDVVYSHLALHYFSKEKTKEIFDEIYRVLKKEGVLTILVNSVNDPEYQKGSKIEDDYFIIGGMKKRYFSKESIKEYVSGFEVLVSDEKGETYKDRAIGVSNLTQFVGRKV